MRDGDRALIVYAERKEDWVDVYTILAIRALPHSLALNRLFFTFIASPGASILTVSIVSASLGPVLAFGSFCCLPGNVSDLTLALHRTLY